MFRNSAFSQTPTFKIVLGISLCTIGGAMLYAYFRREQEEEDSAAELAKKKPQKTKATAKPKPVVINLVVNNEHIPLIVGRAGANLKVIEEKTNTKLKFSDKDNAHKNCQITGLPDDVKAARALLLKEIERSPTVQEEMFVPQSVCGQIMGRCGEALQEICRSSMAKISVDSGSRNAGNMDKRRIVISGNRQQVNIARKLIEDKITEDEELRQAVIEVEQKREPRRSPTNSVSSSLYSSQNSLNLTPREKLLASKVDEKLMEVYLSAIATPSKFWVQLIGPQSKKLDDLVQEMTSYYALPENRALHQISSPALGQIVAAIFEYDNKCYRAEIVAILPNTYNPAEIVFDLYFVDYGDSKYVAPHDVFELRTDFLTLRFQAVECFLANVKSVHSNESETWDKSAIQKFEEITQVASWKKLIARVVTYKERPKASTDVAGQNNAVREGSPIPGVELFDITEGMEINIGNLLITQGLALPPDDQPRARSPYYSFTSPETSLYHSFPQSPITSNLNSPNSPTNNLNDTLITNGNEDHSFHSRNAENALFDQQLQHLQKQSPQTYHNGNEKLALGPDFLNGNTKTQNNVTAAPAPVAATLEMLNGNHI